MTLDDIRALARGDTEGELGMQLEVIEALLNVAEAAYRVNNDINEWSIVQRHSYAHERLGSALTALEKL